MRKTYEKEFKLKICQDIEKKETSIGIIAKSYGISRPIISRWLAEYRRYGNKAFSGQGKRLPDKAKLYAIEQENQRLREENEILKKFELFVKQASR